MSTRIAKIELYPAAGASRLIAGASDNLLDYAHAYPAVNHKLGEASELTFKLKSASPWDGLVRSRMRLKALYDDGSFSEWRIREVKTTTSGADGVTLRAWPVWTDLADRKMRRTLEPDKTVSFAMTFMDLYAEEVLSAILSPAYGCDPRFAPGVAAAQYREATPVVQGVDITHLEALRQLCEQLGCEWDVRWDGQVYRIDLVEHVGDQDAAKRVIEAPTGGAAPSEGNRISLDVTDDGDAYFNRLIPLCGDREFPTTIAHAYWRVTEAFVEGALTRLKLGLKPSPAAQDGLLNGLKLGSSSTGYFTVTSSIAPDTVWVQGDAAGLLGKPARFTSPDGGDLVGLDVPGEGGAVEVSEYFDDIPPEANLYEDAGGSADMSEGASIPVGMQTFGAATTEMIAQPLYVAYGKKSVKVTAAKDGGLESIEIPLVPTKERPYFSFWTRVQCDSGKIGVELEDATGRLWPPSGTIEYGGREPAEITTQGILIEAAGGPARIRFRALEDGAVFYVDALTVTQSNVPAPYSAKMGPRALFAAGANRLLRAGGASSLSYEGEFFDASIIKRTDGRSEAGAEVRLGDYVTVRDRRRDGEWQMNFTARVVELQETEHPFTGRVRKRVRLERKAPDAAARFVSKPAVPAAQAAPHKTQTLSLDGLSVVASADRIATIGADLDGVVAALPLGEPLRIDVRAGTDLIIVGEFVPGDAAVGRQYVRVREAAEAGALSLLIEPRHVEARVGRPIQLDHAAVLAGLQVSPDAIQMSVEEERRARAVTRLTAGVQGWATQLPIEALAGRIPAGAVLHVTDITTGRTQSVTAARAHAEGETALDVHGRDVDLAEGSAVDLAGYYVGSQLGLQRDEIALRVRADQAAASWQAEAAARAVALVTAAATNTKTVAVTALPAALKAGSLATFMWIDEARLGAVGIPYVRTLQAYLAYDAPAGGQQLRTQSFVTLPVGAYVVYTEGQMLARFTTTEAAVNVLSGQVTQYASQITTLGSSLDDLEDEVKDVENAVTAQTTRIATAEGRITTTESQIDQRVTKADFTAAVVGGPLGRLKAALNGRATSLSVEGAVPGETGTAYAVKKSQMVMIIDKTSRAVSYARLGADRAAGATTLAVVDPLQGSLGAEVYAVAGSTVYGFLQDPTLLRTSLNLSLEGITVEAAVMKSSDYTAGSKGWAIKGDGSAELNNVTVRGQVAAGATARLGKDAAGAGKHGLYVDENNYWANENGAVKLRLGGPAADGYLEWDAAAKEMRTPYLWMHNESNAAPVVYFRQAKTGNPGYQASNWWAQGQNNNGDLFFNHKGMNRFWLAPGGGATLTGTLTQGASDRRMKEDIRPLEGALEMLEALTGCRFRWNAEGLEPGQTDIGLIAQEVQRVLPEAVRVRPDGYLTVRYEMLTPLLVEALKEERRRREALEARIARLEASQGGAATQ